MEETYQISKYYYDCVKSLIEFDKADRETKNEKLRDFLNNLVNVTIDAFE